MNDLNDIDFLFTEFLKLIKKNNGVIVFDGDYNDHFKNILINYFEKNKNKEFSINEKNNLIKLTDYFISHNIELDDGEIFHKYIIPLDKKFHLNLIYLIYSNFNITSEKEYHFYDKEYHKTMEFFDISKENIDLDNFKKNFYTDFFLYKDLDKILKSRLILDLINTGQSDLQIITILNSNTNGIFNLKNKINMKTLYNQHLINEFLNSSTEDKIHALFFSKELREQSNNYFLINALEPKDVEDTLYYYQAFKIALSDHFHLNLSKKNKFQNLITPKNEYVDHFLYLLDMYPMNQVNMSVVLNKINTVFNNPNIKANLEKIVLTKKSLKDQKDNNLNIKASSNKFKI